MFLKLKKINVGYGMYTTNFKKEKKRKIQSQIVFSCIRIFAHLMKRTNIDFYY